MQDKVEKTPQPIFFGLTTEDLHRLSYQGGNFFFKTMATTATITAFQSPVKSLLVNFTKYNSFIMPESSTLSTGIYATAKSLYVGSKALFSNGVVRTGYVTSTKNNRPVEEGLVTEEAITEDKIKSKALVNSFYVGCSALGETLVTNSFETRAVLLKSGTTFPKNFNFYAPYNLYKLTANGFGLKLTTSMNSFACMLVLEDIIANRLAIDNPTAKHAFAGAISGALAAFLSHPLSSLKEVVAAQTTINEQGSLINPSTLVILRNLYKECGQSSLKGLQLFLKTTKSQALVRVGLSSMIFTVVAASEKILGHDPLAKILPEQYRPSSAPQSFFAKATPSSNDTAPTVSPPVANESLKP